ncbi:MAG: PKD domain-containing protein [Candidatus Poseidoniales archaeon]|nr:MAG: PKD domain-containing protein [Candidatus Poseidoniales archaeon]
MSTKFIAAIATIIFVSGAFGGVVLERINVSLTSQNEQDFSIDVDNSEGTNTYSLIEIDEGDNDEEEQITWVLHEFLFSSNGGSDAITWDFGDGTTASGSSITHNFQSSGIFLVTATSIGTDKIETASIEITVNRDSFAEVDNMECSCAPTAKDTVIDLVALSGQQSLQGFVQVEHDGSSESCTLRNPLQECHIRVILQRTELGEIVSEEILFDDTFRSNEKVVDFELSNIEFSQGESIQLRLETDQLRDWHKPTAEWSLTIVNN